MTAKSSPTKSGPGFWEEYFPVLDWARSYNREQLSSDIMAGVIVAIMLVPQSMAYALLAGLPPEVGLYASMFPLILYGLFGTSRSLAVGPVAMVSLLVASSIAPLAESGSADPLLLALTLAFMVGAIQFLMGILRIGFIVNFLSHPVLSAFTSSAAIIIGFSQLKHVLGFSVPGFEFFYEQVVYTLTHLNEINPITLIIGLIGIAILWIFKAPLGRWLKNAGMSEGWIVPITKSAPLIIVLLGTLTVMFGSLDTAAGVNIVGEVPSGFPPLSFPSFQLETLQALLPAAIAISMVGYMESVSVAKSLASKRREKIDPNQELIALGLANFGASFTGGYPVTGGISRSVVNFSAGARTGLASIITAGLVIITALFLTPLFFYLPKAMLAAIILVAVANMVDFKTLRSVWSYNRADGLAWVVTFIAVLGVGVETGILYGVAASMILFIWRTSRPHIAEVGRMPGQEIYRNVMRHDVETWPEVLAIRVDQSLYFANTKHLEDTVLQLIADHPEVKDFILIGTAINFIDASAIETLESLHEALTDANVNFHLSAMKGPVLDQLEGTAFYKHLDCGNVHPSTHDAMIALGYVRPEH